VPPYADQAWKDVENSQEGVVRFDHDHYLKSWNVIGLLVGDATRAGYEVTVTDPRAL